MCPPSRPALRRVTEGAQQPQASLNPAHILGRGPEKPCSRTRPDAGGGSDALLDERPGGRRIEQVRLVPSGHIPPARGSGICPSDCWTSKPRARNAAGAWRPMKPPAPVEQHVSWCPVSSAPRARQKSRSTVPRGSGGDRTAGRLDWTASPCRPQRRRPCPLASSQSWSFAQRARWRSARSSHCEHRMCRG